MKHKTADLEGVLLDSAVAKAEGETWEWAPPYSSLWERGGPIIEREQIGLDAGDGVTDWTAYAPMAVKLGIASQDGPTPLIAAMRAYVASKLGEEIELP